MSSESGVTVKDTINKNGNTEVIPHSIEASESDPCMDYKNKRRRSQWWQETEQMLLKRTGLHQKALYYVAGLLLVLLVLVVIVVAMAATWPRMPHQYLFPSCEDPSCLRAVAQVCMPSGCSGWKGRREGFKLPLPSCLQHSRNMV